MFLLPAVESWREDIWVDLCPGEGWEWCEDWEGENALLEEWEGRHGKQQGLCRLQGKMLT